MFKKIEDWFKSILTESKAITWPSRHRVTTDTTVVVVSLIVGAAILALIDFGFLEVYKAAISQIG